MSISKESRALILLALGSPETDDAPLAIACVLSAVHAEAEMLNMGENLARTRLCWSTRTSRDSKRCNTSLATMSA